MPPRPGPRDKKLYFLITGEELTELQRHTWQMTEAFGLDRRIENYQGKHPIGLYRWDLDCLLCLEDTLKDKREYPDKNTSGYRALEGLLRRLREEYDKNFI
jgi:hypothetical protein